MVDLNTLPPVVQRIIAAAQKMDRDHLDEVAVHVCDRGNDTVRRKGLHFVHHDLSAALSDAGLTLPQDA